MWAKTTVLAWILLAGCFCCWAPEAATGRTLRNEQDQMSSCARSGYVFIPCQQPAARQVDRVLYTFTSPQGVDKIQQKCEGWKKPPGICAAFTTGGVLFTPDLSTGHLGSFVGMSDCPKSTNAGSGSSNLACVGTYVYDGIMAQKQVGHFDPVQAGAIDASIAADMKDGALIFVADDKGVTSVLAQLTARYARDGGSGRCGKVGMQQCSLC